MQSWRALQQLHMPADTWSGQVTGAVLRSEGGSAVVERGREGDLGAWFHVVLTWQVACSGPDLVSHFLKVKEGAPA